LDPELLDQASEAGIDVTTNLNAFLRDQIRKARADRLLKENREALDDANAFLARHGLRSGV
jgi:post-segregation antitoxin (ccd killing protein)